MGRLTGELRCAGVQMRLRERQNKGFENKLEQELVSAAAARHSEAMTVLGDAKTRACCASAGLDLRVMQRNSNYTESFRYSRSIESTTMAWT